ncbi:MAG: glycosyl hydrolase, partial [Congregibacter sp.]|nr:glycosyl hydrolase [Congregibacter sp.]
ATQAAPAVFVLVKDANGNVVRRVEGPVEKGFQRITWDLRFPAPEAITVSQAAADEPAEGMMAAPGTYSAALYKRVDGKVSLLDGPVEFEVERLYPGALSGAPETAVAAFWRAWEDASREASALKLTLATASKRVDAMTQALAHSRADAGDLDARVHQLKASFQALDAQLHGNPAKREVGEKTRTTVAQRLSSVERTIYRSLYGPTQTSKDGLKLAVKSMQSIRADLKTALAELEDVGAALVTVGAPYVEGTGAK